jgi:hypothetical protein
METSHLSFTQTTFSKRKKLVLGKQSFHKNLSFFEKDLEVSLKPNFSERSVHTSQQEKKT